VNGDPTKIGHPAAAKQAGVPAELLGLLCEDRAVPVLDKPGPYYLLNPADLPDGPALVALARDRYRLALTRAAPAAQALMAGAEAVLFDARDALEHGTDPVAAVGDDLGGMTRPRVGRRSPLWAAVSDLELAALDVAGWHAALALVDAGRAPAGEH
jgi:hypothetical protein